MNGSTALIKSLVAETLNTAKLDETVGKTLIIILKIINI